MPPYVWIALGVFVVCLVAGSLWAGVKGYGAWRNARPALERMNVASAVLNQQSRLIEQRLTRLEPKTAQLQHDAARLSRHITQARILLGSVKELRTAYRVARFFT